MSQQHDSTRPQVEADDDVSDMEDFEITPECFPRMQSALRSTDPKERKFAAVMTDKLVKCIKDADQEVKNLKSRIAQMESRPEKEDRSYGPRCLRPRNFWCLRLRCKQFREMPVNIDVGYLFAQLGLARYKRKPYDKFEGWDDIKLWDKILEVLCTNLIHEPTMDELVEVFKVYELKYNQNPSLKYMRDPDLKGKILTVFEHKSENIDVPFIPANLEELIARKKEIAKSQETVKLLKFDLYSLIQLSSSDCSLEVVYPPDRSGIEALIINLEDKKELANKYCQDALEIGVDPLEMGPLLSKYPPDSYEYLVANSMPDDG